MKKVGLWICALCLFFLSAVSVAAAAGHSPSSEEQQRFELLLGFDQIPLEKSQGLFSGLGDSIVSWLSQATSSASEAFWGALQRFSLARHAFYSAVVDRITGAVDRILPPSASRTSLGNYGATEPSSIPEPPTISSKSGLRIKLFAIWRQVLQEYRSTSVQSPSPGASCHDVANQQLQSLRRTFKFQVETSICGFKLNRGCTHKFCKLLKHDSEAAVDKVFDILGVNQREVVLAHVARSLACTQGVNEITREAHLEARPMASSFVDPDSYSARMLRLATSPSRLFMNFYSARPRPTFYYRRAMIFRDSSERPQISLEFYVFRSGGEANVKSELLPGRGSSEIMHSVPLLPEGFLKPEKQENSPVIKINTDANGGVAAAAAF